VGAIAGKVAKVRRLRRPDVVRRSLLSLRGDAEHQRSLFGSRKRGDPTEHAVNGMIKWTTMATWYCSRHCRRHAHGVACDRRWRYVT
jgi:hypothetical protein